MAPWSPSRRPGSPRWTTVSWSATESSRPSAADVKSTSYAENVRALAWAVGRGAGEALFANVAGNLCEGTGTNVFLVAEMGIPAGEEDRPADHYLARAEEAFLSSTTRELQPIRLFDEAPLPGVPGPVTEKLTAAFRDLVARTPDP